MKLPRRRKFAERGRSAAAVGAMKVLELEDMARWCGFALWLGAAGFLPLRAIHPFASWLAITSCLVGLHGIGRRSPLQRIVEWREKRLARRIEGDARASIVGGGRVPDALVAILVGGLTWLVPLWAGAYAEKNPGLGASAFAVIIYVLTAMFFGRLVVGRRDALAVTIGEDGVHLPERGFVPYAAIASVSIRDELLVLSIDGASVELKLGESGARLISRAIALRKAKPSAPPKATTTGFRIASVPTELIETLRDGGQPRAERVRVAQVLRVAAPEEVERVADSTADEGLELILRAPEHRDTRT
jgi:hypothetical protein